MAVKRKKKMDVHATLEEKTKAYWKLSHQIRGHTGSITVDSAIRQTNELMAVLNPARHLWKQTASIQGQVIQYGGPARSKKRKDTKNVLKLQTR